MEYISRFKTQAVSVVVECIYSEVLICQVPKCFLSLAGNTNRGTRAKLVHRHARCDVHLTVPSICSWCHRLRQVSNRSGQFCHQPNLCEVSANLHSYLPLGCPWRLATGTVSLLSLFSLWLREASTCHHICLWFHL